MPVIVLDLEEKVNDTSTFSHNVPCTRTSVKVVTWLYPLIYFC